MTNEVGVITGEVTVCTEVSSGQAVVRIQYTGAEEWYGVEGSPLPVVAGAERQLHRAILEAVEKGLPGGLAGAELRRQDRSSP